MKRVLISSAICAVLFALSHRSASAMVEFCPASLDMRPVGATGAWVLGDSSAQLYGVQLWAPGGRIVGGKIAFDTDSGWYTADVQPLTLTAKPRHVIVATGSFTENDFVSPGLYIQFPYAVRVLNAWMYDATAQHDGVLGWEAKGKVECPPAARRDPAHKYPFLDSPDSLSATPSAKSTVLMAKASPPLELTACAEPFKEVTVKVAVTPDFPSESHGDAMSTTRVNVAVNADGTVADAWVVDSSQSRSRDNAALLAARQSTFSGGLSYCRAVPGYYIFSVTFDPN